MKIKHLIIIFLLVFANGAFAQGLEDDSVEVESEGSYLMRGKDSRALARALSLFEAKKKAVDVGAKYLSTKGLIEVFTERKREIYALVAGDVQAKVLEEKWQQTGKSFRCLVLIRATVKDSDFVRAEIQDKAMENEELKESFKEEMEPTVPKEIDPSKDIARAYLLMRMNRWRMAILYLDRLESKYPNWGDIYMAKAIGYYALHEPRQMKRSLTKGCRVGNEEACNDLNSLKKAHSLDLDYQ